MNNISVYIDKNEFIYELELETKTFQVSGNFNMSIPSPSDFFDSIEIYYESILSVSELNILLNDCFRAIKNDSYLVLYINSNIYHDFIKEALFFSGFEIQENTEEDGFIILSCIKKYIDRPLVSIVVPTYKKEYFAKAMDSIMNQTYPNIEIIVSDNCPTEDIKTLVDIFSEKKEITYYRNPEKIHKNIHTCFELAKGKYIKFLLDDDLLHPECVEKMVRVFNKYDKKVSLVTSKRNRIDSFDTRLEDDPSTKEHFINDTYMHSQELVDFMLVNLTNIIGEFSTAMFRKEDLINEKPHFFSILNHEYKWLIDMSCWLNLLSKGNGFYISEPLSYFRQHDQQNSKNLNIANVVEWLDVIEHARTLGFLSSDNLYIQSLVNLKNVFEYYKPKYKDIEQKSILDRYMNDINKKITAFI